MQLFYYETDSCITQTGLKLPMYNRMTLNSQSCLSLSSAGTTGILPGYLEADATLIDPAYLNTRD